MDLQFGMPAGFGDLLAKKYAILQQGADAQTATANADSNLTNVRAKLLPGESEANVGLTNAQAAGVRTNTSLAPGLAKSTIGLQGAQAFGATQVGLGDQQLNKLQYGLGGNRNANGSFNLSGGLPSLSDSLLNGTRGTIQPDGSIR